MYLRDFSEIVQEAWKAYATDRKVVAIEDISARVSTNHVYLITLEDGAKVIGKLSYFGTYEDFEEDHRLINALSINLPAPYEYFVSQSLTKKGKVFTYRYQDSMLDAWVVFYKPIGIDQMLPKKLEITQIQRLGQELAKFHKACDSITTILPDWSKTLQSDLDHLKTILTTKDGQYEHRGNIDVIQQQIKLFETANAAFDTDEWKAIPVFVDWNIGNFSVKADGSFYSRWDYDWFRMSTRMMDFYFFSRVCSTVGDKTKFSYFIDPLMEDRFIEFLRAYHQVFPLTESEVLFLKEAYRFFILNYVVKDGRYFFHEIYASQLQREAFEIYFAEIDKFDPSKILKTLF